MKTVKIIRYSIFGLIGIVLIASLFISNDIHYEKTITINKPIEQVWQFTNSLSGLEKWDPLTKYDTIVKKSIIGKDGVVGARSIWDSEHNKIGKGVATIIKIESPTLFITEVNLEKPYKSKVKNYIKLVAEGDKTLVTWGFDTEIPYPSNITKLLMNLEESVGEDYQAGLTKLKNICEK